MNGVSWSRREPIAGPRRREVRRSAGRTVEVAGIVDKRCDSRIDRRCVLCRGVFESTGRLNQRPADHCGKRESGNRKAPAQAFRAPGFAVSRDPPDQSATETFSRRTLRRSRTIGWCHAPKAPHCIPPQATASAQHAREPPNLLFLGHPELGCHFVTVRLYVATQKCTN